MIFVPEHFKPGSSAICPSRSMRAISSIAFAPLSIAQKGRPSFIVVAAGRGAAQPAAWRVIELYQGFARAFQRWGKATSFVVAHFTRAQLRRLPAGGRSTR